MYGGKELAWIFKHICDLSWVQKSRVSKNLDCCFFLCVYKLLSSVLVTFLRLQEPLIVSEVASCDVQAVCWNGKLKEMQFE